MPLFLALLVFLCQAGGVLPFAKAPGFPSELLRGKWPIPALGSASNSGTGMCTELQEQHPWSVHTERIPCTPAAPDSPCACRSPRQPLKGFILLPGWIQGLYFAKKIKCNCLGVAAAICCSEQTQEGRCGSAGRFIYCVGHKRPWK